MYPGTPNHSGTSTMCCKNGVRRGLSIIEFVGCLVALCGGVILGSMYLGVDLQQLATHALQGSQTVDLSLLGLSGTSDEQAPTDDEAPASDELLQGSSESHATELAGGLESENTGAANEEESTQASEEQLASPVEIELTEAEREQATLAYWTALAACVQEESLSRRSVGKAGESWQLFEYLTYRKENHQRAVDQIEQLDSRGVDPKVTDHAQQVIAWHTSGVKLYQRSLDLLTDGPAGDLSGPSAQSWQSAATQHRMEEKLVQDKHLGVASYLTHTYKSLGPFKPAAFR